MYEISINMYTNRMLLYSISYTYALFHYWLWIINAFQNNLIEGDSTSGPCSNQGIIYFYINHNKHYAINSWGGGGGEKMRPS